MIHSHEVLKLQELSLSFPVENNINLFTSAGYKDGTSFVENLQPTKHE